MENILRGFPNNDPIQHRLDHEDALTLKGSGVKGADVKAAFKEGLKEWLDEKFADFGKWSLGGLAAMALAALTYFGLIASGWHK